MTTQFEQQLERNLDRLNVTLAEATGAPKPMTKALRAAADAAPASGQISGGEFLAKALTAQAAGYISSVQLAEAEQCIAMHKRPPEPIVRAVMDGRAYSPWG